MRQEYKTHRFAPSRFERSRGIRAARPGAFKFLQPSKYGSVSASYGGVMFHSRKEANYAAELDMRKKATDPAERVVWWKRQVRVSLDVNGVHICDYICDFLVKYADGHMQYEEVKGFDTDVWRLKEKLFRALFPKRILKVIR